MEKQPLWLKKKEGGKAMKQWKKWVFSKCGHIIVAENQPSPIKWSDGHMCTFIQEEEKKEDGTINLQRPKGQLTG